MVAGVAVMTPVQRPLGHFRLEHICEAVETLPGRNLSQNGLVDKRHAIRVNLSAPARIDEIGADGREREGLDETAEGGILREFRLRDNRLPRWQQTEGLAVHEAWLIFEHEAHE